MNANPCISPVAAYVSRTRTLFAYVGGTLMTMGYYADAETAKSVSDVGRWIELGEGSDNWRSEDSRTLILASSRDALAMPGGRDAA